MNTIQDWLKQNYTHVTLDGYINNGTTTLKVPNHNVDLTFGLISTNNKDEFAKLAFTYVPLGTIIEPLEDDWYETKILQVRNLLTRKYINDPRAKHLLEVLERRDKAHWQKDTTKSAEIKKGDEVITFRFE